MSNIDKQDSQVQRYANFGVDMMEWDDGGYVKYSDYVALLGELEAKDKRIAELEAQEVREEGNQFLVVRHPGKAPVIKHSAGDLEGFLRQLLEHEPMATIDIVTHRYYGVGGQWVQDADEYLQMMTAAAGKGE